MYTSSTMVDSLVGAASPMSTNQQFKDDIASIYDSYANEGVNVFDSLGTIAQDRNLRQAFIDMATESVENDSALHSGDAASDPFYSTYADRLKQLEDNVKKVLGLEIHFEPRSKQVQLLSNKMEQTPEGRAEHDAKEDTTDVK